MGLKEKWEASSLVFALLIAIGAYVAGIKTDDWFRGRQSEWKAQGANSQATKTTVRSAVKNTSTEAHTENQELSASSTCSDLRKQASDLLKENQRLQKEYAALKGKQSGTSPKGEDHRKPATFDARLDFDAFCRVRFGSRFVRIREDSFDCGGGEGSVSVQIAEACFWSFGSSRYSLEPVPPSVFCDSSALSEPPCATEQRVCGADSRYCCPKKDEFEPS